MSTERVVTDNELIAEFMDGVHEVLEIMTVGGKRTGKWTFPNGLWCFDDQLDYDVSWSRLMPVVEKINSLEKTTVCIYPKHCMINVDMVTQAGAIDHGDSCSLIEIVYVSVVTFIKWYNSNGPIKENSPEDGVRKHE